MNESKKQQKKAKVGKDSQASAVSKVKPAKKKSTLVKESAKDSKTDEASLDSVSLFLFLFCLFIYLLISFWYQGISVLFALLTELKKCHYDIS